MKKTLIPVLAAALILPASAARADAGCCGKCVAVPALKVAGPFTIVSPYMVDSLDVNSGKYDVKSALDAPMNLGAVIAGARTLTDGIIAAGDAPALGVVSFTMTNTAYATPEVKVKGLKDFRLFVDDKKAEGKLKLRPGTHRVAVKFVTEAGKADTVRVSLCGVAADAFAFNAAERLYTLDNVLNGTRINAASVSPDGRYIITARTTGLPDGQTTREWQVSTIAGRPVTVSQQPLTWMPRGAAWYRTVTTPEGRTVIVTDAATGASRTWATGLPEGSLVMMPDETKALIIKKNKAPAEDKDVYEIREPEDRQPGFRTRTSLELYDAATGLCRPLTFGHKSVNLLDVSDDGTKALIMTRRMRYTARPTSLFTIAVLDLNSMKADTIVADDGFLSGAIFSPDARRVLVSGSPEALGGIGKNVPEGVTPSMTDNQLFMIDLRDGSRKALTRDFNPSVSRYEWSRADGKVYFNAADRDRVSLFRLDPANGKIRRLDVGQDLVNAFSLPRHGNTAVLLTQDASNPGRLYTLDTRSGRATMLEEPLAEQLKDVKLGRVEAWDFVNSRGDTICGRFYLPPDFDPARKYPLIVNYYGGCSPIERSFESRYPHHAYAAQDYVVYVVEPSGATGFGQEFSSRHVSTAGDGPDRDIIEGTKKFCEEHPFVDPAKIGCIGASYGGFMTQYLQTVTDIFAAAVSHAGISDHTSYWGEGYWGYSYSEVSMGDNYPWTNKKLYVDQSPLYNADKIHTPLLFLHGDADHNVPVGESIQMFTALKLLGRPTAFVAVKDQDHHIMEHDKRIKWQDTIFAWFARYLKSDPTWWNALYPDKAL